MAQQNYITLEDITLRHLKQFPPEEIQPYIDEANDYYEEFARDNGIIDMELLVTPIEPKVKRMLLYFLYFRFGSDNVGVNDVEVMEEDVYLRMQKRYSLFLNDAKREVTPSIMCGTSFSKSSRAVSTIKMMRSS